MKSDVREYWEQASCGEALYLDDRDADAYSRQASARYELEPFIRGFAGFESAKNKDVLEIGVGLGADHECFARSGARLRGIDLTDRAIWHTSRRLGFAGLESELSVADAENLPFEDSSFDLVYSWGVLHHSPDTEKAVSEVLRVLRPGGLGKVMIYHKYSMVGYMLWARYALASGKPWTSLSRIYSDHLESPGTKAYSIEEARRLFRGFTSVSIETVLTHGDLLSSGAGQRHAGRLLDLARRLWPRGLIRTLLPDHGLFMLIIAVK